MPPSSLGSTDEEEGRCENDEVRSEDVWSEAVVAGGCGLCSPVRLSRGTGVRDAAVTSLVLTWGFTWFLSRGGKTVTMSNTNMKLKMGL